MILRSEVPGKPSLACQRGSRRRTLAGMEGKRIPRGRLILMHGLDQAQAVAAMRAVKAALGSPDDLAFAMTTESNLDWPVAELVEHVLEEHEFMRKNPPGRA